MLFTEINEYAGINYALDAIMVFCANTLIFCWPLLLLLAWGLPLGWRKRALSEQDKARLQQRRASILWIIIACAVAYGINLTIEQFVFEPRPFITHHVNLLVHHVADSSFPSDHTAWSFAVVGMLILSQLPWLLMRTHTTSSSAPTKQEHLQGILHSPIGKTSLLFCVIAIAVACVIGVARVFVGIHYPDDIVGGAFDGIIAAIIVTLLRRGLQRPTQVVLRFAERMHVA
jgi:undecaprenyl-diphosphatase